MPALWLLGAIAVVAAVAIVVSHRRLAVVTIEGISMLPAYCPGDQVLIRRTRIGAVRVGEVVVFERVLGVAAGNGELRPERPRSWLIKRVAALPGDAWPCMVAIAGSCAEPADSGATVPNGSIAVLGDNRGISYDSRQLGCIRHEQVLGVVIRKIA